MINGLQKKNGDEVDRNQTIYPFCGQPIVWFNIFI